ncbi:ABC transporter substrate-binding protein [Arthrobacter crystallopoietes]|uniref:ABC transporter substrate-binding protein n=1 Tax=Crystallibacter crystallopoietes TaxID=37928 RepID=UPI001ABE344D|nr:ABC transporter substrate-binding protein [Arthrobacter crystallopoietes]QTG79736.1 ABC transporter substrate-binding protein [Arthrobacter crystallopoietes]
MEKLFRGSTTKRRTFMTCASAAALTGLLALTGCGSGSPSAPENAANSNGAAPQEGLDQVSVGLIPITDVAPIYLGMQEGYFEDEGIQLSVQLAQGGAAIVPAVMTGEYQFGYSNVVSLLIAQDKTLPVKVVSNGSSSTNVPGKDVTEVAAMPDSGIESAADLVGKTVAVNALNNFADVTIRNSIEKAGGDPQDVNFVEMPYPNMPAALERGDVDAAWTTEPFRTQILEAGGEIVASPMTDLTENFDSAFYFTSEQTLQEDPELVERFQRALDKSFTFAMENEDEVRTIIQDYAKITPELAETVEMSKWYPEINMDGLRALGTAAQKYGVLENEPDYDALIAK